MKATMLIPSVLALTLSIISYSAGLEDWQGDWQGNCQNNRPGQNPTDGFRGSLKIESIPGTESYVWSRFGRDYQMNTVNQARGHYQLDEKPGIIDHYLTGNTLYSHFEIQGVQITAVDRLEGDRIVSELLVFHNTPAYSTMGLDSFRFSNNQKCIFTR